MKAFRLLAAILFLLAAGLHMYIAVKAPSSAYFEFALIFAIVYTAIGALLLMNKKYAPWLGLIPIIPLIPASLQLDLNKLNWTFAMFVLEIMAVVCCILLLIKMRKAEISGSSF
jgi:hypothetical protein